MKSSTLLFTGAALISVGSLIMLFPHEVVTFFMLFPHAVVTSFGHLF